MFDTIAKNWLIQNKLEPVCVDVGASGDSPLLWKEIARQSLYVGFEPGEGQVVESTRADFKKSWLIREAVASDPSLKKANLFHTQFPYCSSLLRPDEKALSNYLFSDLFAVKNEEALQVTSLTAALKKTGLDRIDWLKLDTQGTDLRIFNSVEESLKNHILAVDIEPGLIDAYLGEDLFVQAHASLVSQGFWLSNLQIGKAVRMRRASYEKIAQKIPASRLGESPAWVEARYLRSLQHLADKKMDKNKYFMLAVFSLLDGKAGFAIDLILECQKIFGTDPSMDDFLIVLERQLHRPDTLSKKVLKKIESLLCKK